MRIVRGACGFGFVVLLLILVGCGGTDPMSEVSGTVKVNGKEAEAAVITFFPANGPTAGAEVKEGAYSVQVPLGISKVEIRMAKAIAGKTRIAEGPGAGDEGYVVEVLPAKYNDRSELTFEVKASKNEKNWDLTTK